MLYMYYCSMEGGELFTRIQERADTAFTERGLILIIGNNHCTKQCIVVPCLSQSHHFRTIFPLEASTI